MKKLLLSTAAAIAITLMIVAPLSAQQPVQDTTARNQALERLRARAPLISPDTLPADSLAADSLAPPPPQLVEIVGDTTGAPRGVAAGGLMADDSIARQLLRLSGYVATEYSAPRARYDADSATLRLMGASAVVREGQVLNADSSIVFYEDTGFACGFGAPRLEGEGFDAPLASDSLCYDVDRRVGRAYGLSTSLTESATWYVQGQCWTVEDRLYCHDTMFTDCDVKEPHPHYHFRANDVKVVRGNVLVARDVTVNFADVPVFWLPVMMQSLARGRRTGILFPEFGIGDIARTSSGYNRRISNIGMFWAINDYMGLKVAGGWEANNHSNIELGYEYSVLRRFLRGGITVNRYWMDTGQRNLTFRTTNSWQPDERTNLALTASYTSSTQLITERSYDPAELNRSIDSYANLNRKFDWGSVSLGGSRKQLLTDETVTWKLPGLSLSLPSITLFEELPDQASWYNNVTWTGSGSFDYGRTDIADLNPDLRQSERGVTSSARHSLQLGRLGLSQNISFTSNNEIGRAVPDTDSTEVLLPDSTRHALVWQTSLSFQQRLFAKTTITPSLSFSGQTVARNEQQVAAPMQVSVGAQLGTDLYGFFPGFGPFERLRHRISPTFNYSYSPRPSVTDEQRDFFGIGELRGRNTLTFGLSQTFEAKYRATEDTTAAADSAAAVADTATGPRRPEQARIITLLSISAMAVAYDFVQARENGEGITTTSLSTTLSTDLLPNFALRLGHDLFRRDPVEPGAPGALPGDLGDRHFDPFLTGASFGFRLNSDSWIARTLGLGRAREPEPEPEVAQDSVAGAGAVPERAGGIGDWNQGMPDQGLIGTSGDERNSPDDAAIGTWSANFDYVLDRRRPSQGADGLHIDNSGSQTVRGTFRMQPTRHWALSWATGYDFTNGQFSDHRLSLTRRLHDFDANFDFIKAQNGNFLFMFRVQLRASPDLKVDYTQRDLDRGAGFQ